MDLLLSILIFVVAAGALAGLDWYLTELVNREWEQ